MLFSAWTLQMFTESLSSIQFSCSVMSDFYNPMDCSTPGFPIHHQLLELSNSCPSSEWCHPTISSSVVPFSSCIQSFPASGSFPVSQLFASGGRSVGVSATASVLPWIFRNWFPLGLTGLVLQSKGLSRVPTVCQTVWDSLSPYCVSNTGFDFGVYREVIF